MTTLTHEWNGAELESTQRSRTVVAVLWTPSAASYGASVLAVTMVGAIITHLFIVGGSPVVPILLFASTLAIAWMRRSDR
jgi:putative oxidoreductase